MTPGVINTLKSAQTAAVTARIGHCTARTQQTNNQCKSVSSGTRTHGHQTHSVMVTVVSRTNCQGWSLFPLLLTLLLPVHLQAQLVGQNGTDIFRPKSTSIEVHSRRIFFFRSTLFLSLRRKEFLTKKKNSTKNIGADGTLMIT